MTGELVDRGVADVFEVHVTCPDREVAERLARALVERRLAACVNVGSPITSVYRWNDDVEVDDEVLLVAKTVADRLAELTDTVERLHPYEVPSITGHRLEHVNRSYRVWVDDETRDTH